MRLDVHTLFDGGYLTITPDLTFRVSSKFNDDFDDRETYREFDRKRNLVPTNTDEPPNREFLEWHNDMVFLK